MTRSGRDPLENGVAEALKEEAEIGEAVAAVEAEAAAAAARQNQNEAVPVEAATQDEAFAAGAVKEDNAGGDGGGGVAGTGKSGRGGGKRKRGGEGGEDSEKKKGKYADKRWCLTCGKHRPSFAAAGERRVRCGHCKLDTDVNVRMKSTMCQECKKVRASFAPADTKKALRCSKCKHASDVDVNSKRCVSCKIKCPSYNQPGEKVPLRCGACKIEGDKDVRHQKRKATTNALADALAKDDDDKNGLESAIAVAEAAVKAA